MPSYLYDALAIGLWMGTLNNQIHNPGVESDGIHSRRLLSFLLSLRIFAAAFASLELIIGLAVAHWPLIMVAAATYAACAVTYASRRLVRKGRLKTAASLAGYSVIAAASLAAPLAPYGATCLVLVPIVGVAAVLPYLRGRELGVFLGVAFVSMVGIVASSSWLGDRFQFPGPVGERINVIATIAPSFMLLLLLWQFSHRLRATLDAEREARQKAELERARAQEAVQLRDEFLSIASHELRTPLMSLQLTVQGLRLRALPSTPENLDRSLSLAERQVVKLGRLVSDMLTIGRIQVGRLDLDIETMDLAELVREVAARFSTELSRTRSPLELKLAPVLGRWDRNKLDQVVTNLFSNAIKFGAGKPIEVTVEERAGTARLVVVDHGIGIDPEALPSVFQKFERAVPARRYGGLGLGLFITRTIIEALGGVIRAESPGHDRGTTFVAELPCAGPASERPRAMSLPLGAAQIARLP
jgi:signal transduction histidine kinase